MDDVGSTEDTLGKTGPPVTSNIPVPSAKRRRAFANLLKSPEENKGENEMFHP